MRIASPPLRKARIEIIPMIDTIFFLLVFFMFSALSMVRMRAMNLAIPRSGGASSSAGKGSRPPTVILTVTGSGNYFLNTDRITPQTLQANIRSHIAANPNAVVVLNVAPTRSTDSLVKIMDMVNEVHTPTGGSVKMLLATEPVDLHGRALPPGSGPGGTEAGPGLRPQGGVR